jgi:hypothetical protein
MTRMTFMSAEHVAAMNARLAAAADVRAAVAKLEREILWVHKLWDDHAGRYVWWQNRFSPAEGISLALGKPEREPTTLFTGNYWDMVAAVAETVAGRPREAPVKIESGDPDFMRDVADIHSLAWQAALIDVDYPSRPER